MTGLYTHYTNFKRRSASVSVCFIRPAVSYPNPLRLGMGKPQTPIVPERK